MKFSKALVALTPFFLFGQAAAEEPAEPSSSGPPPKPVVVSSTRSSDGPVHLVIPYHGNEEGNGTDRKKQRELETTDYGTDARFLDDVVLNYGNGGFPRCGTWCGSGYHRCSHLSGWDDGKSYFTDPLDVPVGEMRVEVVGDNCFNHVGIEVSLNGNDFGVLPSLNDGCGGGCNDCYSSSSCLPINPAWYTVSGMNEFKLTSINSVPMCINRVELDLLPATVSQKPVLFIMWSNYFY